jgi:site-specific recombinase XerD
MIFYIIKDLAKKAGIIKNISPHTFGILLHTFGGRWCRPACCAGNAGS